LRLYSKPATLPSGEIEDAPSEIDLPVQIVSRPPDQNERKETERFKSFAYQHLMARDKASLDIFWLRDESLEDTDNLPPPEVIAAEIVEDLQAALAEFAAVAESLRSVN